jgi:hypothetical protein
MRELLRSVLVPASLCAALALGGCSVGVGYRVYDPYHSDYHVWNAGEGVYYNRWTAETHHDPHRDFRKLNHDDQQAYWNWRHDQH